VNLQRLLDLILGDGVVASIEASQDVVT
jgi:hypothetical protein